MKNIFSLLIPKAYADTTPPSITNPAVPTFGQGAPELVFAKLIATVWQTAITLGALALLVMLIMGALEWITAGGEKGKIEQARARMTQSVIGMLALVAVAAISIFLGATFGLDLLRPQFANNISNQPCNLANPSTCF